MSVSKIMVIIDPTQEEQPAFERGLESAHLTGARLHLYACLDDNTGNGSREAQSSSQLRELELLATRSEGMGVEVTVELDWGENWAREAIHAAARCSASMLFKNSFRHSALQREMRHTSDWTLMRLAPCPVLMVKNIRDWQNRRVLAAIKTKSSDNTHVKLNHQIVSFTQQYIDAYGSDGHFVTAYTDRNHTPEKARLADSLGAPPEHVHVVQGNAYSAITRVAESLEADLIIIGTVGRSGIKGQIVGNTAERILDHTDADVLVIN